MFEIGWSELAIIALVALVALGPKELPKAMKSFAAFTRKMQRYAREFRSGVDNIIREANDLLDKRELIKCAVQQNAPLSAKEAIIELCDRTGASPVQTIGRRFTIYRQNEEEPVITLP